MVNKADMACKGMQRREVDLLETEDSTLVYSRVQPDNIDQINYTNLEMMWSTQDYIEYTEPPCLFEM